MMVDIVDLINKAEIEFDKALNYEKDGVTIPGVQQNQYYLNLCTYHTLKATYLLNYSLLHYIKSLNINHNVNE